MKVIGLLGGTGWPSSVEYYTLLNKLVAERLGGYNSAEIVLSSSNYREVMENYGKNPEFIRQWLKTKLLRLISFKPDCIIICCNSLHKYYDMIKSELASDIPVMHAIELIADRLNSNGQKKVLLLATKATMEDGFFSKILEDRGIQVVIPELQERDKMHEIHTELMHNTVTPESRDYFANLISQHKDLDAVILGCTEYPLVVDEGNSVLSIINPVHLQIEAAVEYSLSAELDHTNAGFKM